MTEIQREFVVHNPHLCYIDHRYIPGNRVGIAFIAIVGSSVMGGVRLYNIVNGNVDWEHPGNTYDSWNNIQQRSR